MTTDSMGVGRAQHLIPAIIILSLAMVVAYLSFTREPAEAFLFPRMISAVMLFLSTWNFVRALLGMARVGEGISFKIVLNIAPGIIIMSAFVFFAAKFLGFYVASFFAFLCVYSVYDPASHLAISSWVRRISITVVFMGIIYGLFTLLLKVQTPRGLFF